MRTQADRATQEQILFERAIQTAIENMIHSRGINRIRHYYVEPAPEVARYFIHSTHDDAAGALHGMGIVPRPRRGNTT
jgi:hypothetical protein